MSRVRTVKDPNDDHRHMLAGMSTHGSTGASSREPHSIVNRERSENGREAMAIYRVTVTEPTAKTISYQSVRQIVLNCRTEGAIVAEKIENHRDDPNVGCNATTER